MPATQHHRLIILGSGPAGCTAAIYAARAGLAPALLQGSQPGGQLTITTEVENYPGFAEPVMGPELMDAMHKQAVHCGTTMLTDTIVKAELNAPPFALHSESGTVYTCDALIVATGASAKWLGMASEQKFSGRGVSACATCDGPFFRKQDVAVIGGGNSAMEEALFLANFCNHVTVIHRRDSFRGEKVLQERVAAHPKITTLWNHAPDEILGEDTPTGGVTGIRVKHVETGATQEIPVMGVFVAIGHKPNTDLFKGVLDMDAYGYLTVKPGTVNTNIEGVFAAGDVCDATYRQAVTAAGMGCMAALDAARYLESGHPSA